MLIYKKTIGSYLNLFFSSKNTLYICTFLLSSGKNTANIDFIVSKEPTEKLLRLNPELVGSMCMLVRSKNQISITNKALPI